MRLVGISALLWMVQACVAQGSSPPPPPTPPPGSSSDLSTVAGFCEARATAECNATVVKHCGATDATSCDESRKATCLAGVPQGTTYVKAQGPVCIKVVTDAYADGEISVDEDKAIAEACGPALFSGPGAARSPCTVAYDCSSADGLTCILPRGATTGKCLKPNAVAAAAPCPGEADQCSDGFYCDAQSMTCKTDAVAGELCDPVNRPCGPGLTCPGGGPFGQGCQVKGGNGLPCNGNADCGNALCDKAAGQAAGTCADKIMLTSFDDACTTFK